MSVCGTRAGGQSRAKRTQRVGEWLCVVGELALAGTCTSTHQQPERKKASKPQPPASSTWAAKRDAQNEGKKEEEDKEDVEKSK